jgi:hypothetical protein
VAGTSTGENSLCIAPGVEAILFTAVKDLTALFPHMLIDCTVMYPVKKLLEKTTPTVVDPCP